MQVKVLLLLLLINFSVQVIAQDRITIETKLTLVVNEKNDKIIDVELFDEKQFDNLKKRYPNSKLFIGRLQGSYELENRRVKPKTGSTITVFTERQFLPNENFLPNQELIKGRKLSIGSIKAKIESNTKGELILTTQ